MFLMGAVGLLFWRRRRTFYPFTLYVRLTYCRRHTPCAVFVLWHTASADYLGLDNNRGLDNSLSPSLLGARDIFWIFGFPLRRHRDENVNAPVVLVKWYPVRDCACSTFMSCAAIRTACCTREQQVT